MSILIFFLICGIVYLAINIGDLTKFVQGQSKCDKEDEGDNWILEHEEEERLEQEELKEYFEKCQSRARRKYWKIDCLWKEKTGYKIDCSWKKSE